MSTQDLTLQWAIAAAIGMVLLLRRRLTLFHPEAVYLAFHVLAFCLRPTLLVAFDLDAVWRSIPLAPEPEDLRQALWISTAGLAAFCAGSMLGSFRADALKAAEPPEPDRSDLRALLVTSAITVPAGLVAFVATIGYSSAGSGYAADLVWVALPVSLLAILAARWRWWGMLPLAVVASARASITTPALAIVSASILGLVLWLWSHQQRRPSLAIVAVGAAIAFAALLVSSESAALAGWLRGSEAPHTPDARGSALVGQFDRREFAHFDALTYVATIVPEKSGTFSHGEQHLSAWRETFGSEPVRSPLGHRHFGAIDLDRLGHFRDLPVALTTDGWISGGWTGVALTLGLAGLALGAAFRWFSHRQDDPAAACLYLIVHVLALGLYSASSMALIPIALIAAAPLILWRILGRRFRAAEAARADRERLREERQRRRTLGTALLNPHAAPIPPEVLASASDESATEIPTLPRETPAPVDGQNATDSPEPGTSRSGPPTRPAARWRETPPR